MAAARGSPYVSHSKLGPSIPRMIRYSHRHSVTAGAPGQCPGWEAPGAEHSWKLLKKRVDICDIKQRLIVEYKLHIYINKHDKHTLWDI